MNCQTNRTAVRLLKMPPEGAELLRAIPETFPKPNFSRHGVTPAAVYAYHNHDGSLACLIARIEVRQGEKRLLPATVWTGPDQRNEWYTRALPDARPLYRLPELLEAPEKPVLISEGEKCADALAPFDSYCSVTWAGGSKALTKTDFRPLAGRDIIILPDLDAAGQKAADELTDLLHQVDAASIQRLDIEKLANACGMEPIPGFDIADAIEQGLDAAGFAALLEKPGMLMSCTEQPPADPTETPSQTDDPVLRELQDRFGINPEDLPRVFSISVDGLVKRDVDARGMPLDIYAGSPLVVLGRTHACHNGQGWGYIVALRTPTKKWMTLVIPGRLLAGDGRELRELLADAGAIIPQTRAGRQAQAEYIGYAQTREIVQLADRPGWHGDSFALPQKIIQPKDATETILLDMTGRQHFLRTTGDMGEWQKLARLAEPNSRAAFAICVAFSAPLLGLLDRSGAGFHLFGQSSRGKTTLLTIAGSVWGGGGKDGYGRNWRMTSNGAEGLISDHNDLLLCLDELTMTTPDQALELFYMLSDGHGKVRANQKGGLENTRQSRVMLLSSGENAASHQLTLGKSKTRMTGGASVRMIDIPIECSPGMSFESLCGTAHPGALAEEMARLARSHYGHAGPAFLQAIIDRKSKVTSAVEELQAEIIQELVEPEDDPQIRRVAAHFGLVAAAGELARQAGILPWRCGSASRAVLQCFRAWKAHRGGGRSQEEREALAHLKAFFESQGRTRFERIVHAGCQESDELPARSSDFAVRDRCGYYIDTEEDGPIYYILPEAFRREVCGDHNPELMIKIARAHGALIPGEKGRPQKKKRLPDYPGGIRVYALRPDKLV